MLVIMMGSYSYECMWQLMPQRIMNLKNLQDWEQEQYQTSPTTTKAKRMLGTTQG